MQTISGPKFAVSDLSLSVADRRLVSDFRLSLQAGERVALMGPSGCGKTTLLRTLCGLSDPASGTVLLEDRSPENWGWTAYRRQVVYVEQRPALLDLTIEETLRRPFTYRSAQTGFPEKEATNLLHALGLEMSLDQKARSLSVGQQQRLCLIRALLLIPSVLLLDEPTSALDATAVQQVEDLIRLRCDTLGLSALIVTHQTEQAERWCHRRILLCPPMEAKQ